MCLGLQHGTTTPTTIHTSQPLATHFDHNQVRVDRSINALQARVDSISGDLHMLTFITTGAFTVGSTTVVSNGQTTVIPITSMATRTLTTQTSVPTNAEHTGTQNGVPSAIIGVVTGTTGIIILGLIAFFILRRRRRYKVVRLASTHEISTSSDTLDRGMPQSVQSSTTPQPFRDFPVMQIYPPSKRIIADRPRTLPTQVSQGDIGQAVDPFKDPVLVESLTDNNDESQRVRDALDSLQALTSRFEGELQHLGALVQSGQLSSEDQLKLEEIKRTTGLTIQFDSRHDRFSIVRSVSSGSGSSFSLSPPSYHTRGS